MEDKHNKSDSEENDEMEDENIQRNSNPLANLDEETKVKIQEMQILEQNLQQLLMQKQSFNMELDSSNFALNELEKTEDDVFKVVGGQIIIKTTKEKLQKDLGEKKKLLELRLKNIDKQEKEFYEKLESLRDEITKKIINK